MYFPNPNFPAILTPLLSLLQRPFLLLLDLAITQADGGELRVHERAKPPAVRVGAFIYGTHIWCIHIWYMALIYGAFIYGRMAWQDDAIHISGAGVGSAAAIRVCIAHGSCIAHIAHMHR